VIHTGSLAYKSSSGYDLTRLFAGTEGTLGVVTEATLKLTGLPSSYLAATVTFNRLEAASRTVAVLIGAGLEPAALELLPPELICLINRERDMDLAEAPSLFCEFHGISESTLAETAELARELCEECGATGFKSGISTADRKQLWRARHEAAETIQRAHPGKKNMIVDAAVPLSCYSEMVLFSQAAVDTENVPGYVFGHAGDGNLHVMMMGDPGDKAEWSRLEAVNHRIVTRAVELGGTCTGEHGIGIGKRRFMELEHGESYALMRRIKEMIDPEGLMNPGKIF
jgi:D-lactate dehydrogenase (cytochrome)